MQWVSPLVPAYLPAGRPAGIPPSPYQPLPAHPAQVLRGGENLLDKVEALEAAAQRGAEALAAQQAAQRAAEARIAELEAAAIAAEQLHGNVQVGQCEVFFT